MERSYPVKLRSVYDGDTLRADINLGFGLIFQNAKIRLAGIDTPELRGEEKEQGRKVKEYLKTLLEGKVITLRSPCTRKGENKKGKYGRFLGYLDIVEDGKKICVNDLLIQNGLAQPYTK